MDDPIFQTVMLNTCCPFWNLTSSAFSFSAVRFATAARKSSTVVTRNAGQRPMLPSPHFSLWTLWRLVARAKTPLIICLALMVSCPRILPRLSDAVQGRWYSVTSPTLHCNLLLRYSCRQGLFEGFTGFSSVRNFSNSIALCENDNTKEPVMASDVSKASIEVTPGKTNVLWLLVTLVIELIILAPANITTTLASPRDNMTSFKLLASNVVELSMHKLAEDCRKALYTVWQRKKQKVVHKPVEYSA